jgi:hypothetical protein
VQFWFCSIENVDFLELLIHFISLFSYPSSLKEQLYEILPMFQLNITAKFLQSLVWLSGNPNNLALESISALFTDFTLCKISKQRRSNVHCGVDLK